MTTTALVLSCDVDAIIAQRDAVVRAAEQVDAIVRSAPNGFPQLYVNEYRHREVWSLASVRREADRAGWHEAMMGSGMWTFLDHKAREEWRKMLDENKFPELTKEAIEDTFREIHAKRGALVARGIGELFRDLSGHYKTNKAAAFGRRIIINYVATTWRASLPSANYRICDKLDDLTRFCCLLRGLPEPDSRGSGRSYERVHAAIVPGGNPWTIDFEFFTVKLFLNGCGHLTFKHDDDVKRLNAALSMESRVDGKIVVPDSVRR